jgi:predicted small lipoprotein YifL
MRIHRSIQALTLVTTVAALTACGSMGGRHQPDDTVVAVQQWDSGPLDRSYQGQKTDMDARHQQEIANPRAGESPDQAKQRQTAESKDLDARYAQGKASHSQTMPAAEQKQDDHADKPAQ